jgi:hypothetical protein
MQVEVVFLLDGGIESIPVRTSWSPSTGSCTCQIFLQCGKWMRYREIGDGEDPGGPLGPDQDLQFAIRLLLAMNSHQRLLPDLNKPAYGVLVVDLPIDLTPRASQSVKSDTGRVLSILCYYKFGWLSSCYHLKFTSIYVGETQFLTVNMKSGCHHPQKWVPGGQVEKWRMMWGGTLSRLYTPSFRFPGRATTSLCGSDGSSQAYVRAE